MDRTLMGLSIVTVNGDYLRVSVKQWSFVAGHNIPFLRQHPFTNKSWYFRDNDVSIYKDLAAL